MSVQDNIAAGYLADFERPIGVSIQSKLMKWPFLQKLGFAGALTHTNTTFHGLKDFDNQMSAYSSTHPLLLAAWKVIKQIAPLNLEVEARMFASPVLGQVGNEFQSLTGFGEVFAIAPDQLNSPAAIASGVAAAGSKTLQGVTKDIS